MQKNELYKWLLQLGIHFQIRDQQIQETDQLEEKNLGELAQSIHNILNELEEFSGILNKTQLVKNAAEGYVQIMPEEIDDEAFFEQLIPHLKEADMNSRKNFIDGAIYIAKRNDNVISEEEKNLLEYLYNELEVSSDNLDQYMDNTIKDKKKRGKNKKSSNLKKIAPGIVLILVLSGVLFYLFNQDRAVRIEDSKLSNVVYKKIYFERYVVAGNYKGGSRSKKLGKMIIFYIKGNADVKFDLKNLELKKISDNQYTAVYYNKQAKQRLSKNSLPFSIDVNIAPKDYYQIKEIQPDPISESEAKKVAKPAGVLAGIAGGVVGAQLGGSVGSATGNPVFSLLGMGTGGLLGAGAAGSAGYVATSNFLTGAQITSDINQGDKEKILHKSKLLVASDILLKDSVVSKLQKDFEEYVKSFYKQFDIKVSDIKYQKSI